MPVIMHAGLSDATRERYCSMYSVVRYKDFLKLSSLDLYNRTSRLRLGAFITTKTSKSLSNLEPLT